MAKQIKRVNIKAVKEGEGKRLLIDLPNGSIERLRKMADKAGQSFKKYLETVLINESQKPLK